MANFYYDDNNDSGLIIPIASFWTNNSRDYGSTKQAGKILTSPVVGGTVNLHSHTDSIATKQYILLGQYVSEGLASSTGLELGTIMGYIAVRESSTSMNATPAIVVKLVSNDGQTVRGEFFRYAPIATVNEFGTSTTYYYPRPFPSSSRSDILTVQEGDKIVVEVGIFSNNTSTSIYSASIYLGSNSTYSDCPTGSTDTGKNTNPWISFSTALTFVEVNISPIINIISYDKSKISAQVDKDICTVTFQSNQNLLEWEARADGTSQGNGLLVGNGTTVTANTNVAFTIENEELTSGHKKYHINIYGRNESGVWSVYE